MSFTLLDEGEDAAFVADGDVEKAIAVEIGDDELRADAGVVVDEVRLEGHGLRRGIADSAEPIQDGGSGGFGVAMRAVGPVALAGDDIEDAVAIDIGENGGVELGELEVVHLFSG